MQIKLYSTAKKINSTRRPPVAALVATVDANIKDNCSITNPVLLLDYGYNDFNYVYIAGFGGRYYFVDDIVLNHGLIEVYCSIDVLATYKTEIGSTSMYITRASNAYDGDIIDNNYPGKNNIQVTDTSIDITELNFTGFENGYYVLGVQGNTPVSTNAVIYFQLTPSQFSNVLKNFYANTGSSWWGNMASGVKNALNKIDDFIVSCRWFPFQWVDPTDPNQLYQNVFLGMYDTGISAPVLSTNRSALAVAVTLPTHSQAAARGNWLKKAPYTRYDIIDPLFGRISLNPEDITGTGITIQIKPDYTTGVCQYSVLSGTSVIYYTYEKLGIDISLNGASIDVLGAIGNVGGAVVKAAVGDWIGAASNIGNAAVNSFENPGNKGPAGGYASLMGNRIVRAYFMLMADEDNANSGRPYCKMATPATLTGFIRAENPHVVTLGTDTETNMINSMIEAGIYYE